MVARLKAAGAIMVGKTNTPTLGWLGATHNLLFGATRNPWNLDRTPGGSSGGASAAVAGGLGPLGVGTDGGGSIRIPASFAGIFGHKPSYGRIPTYPASAAWSLSHIGPMTRTVADAALMMQVCAGPDERDPYSLPRDGVDYVRAIRGGRQGAPGRLRRGPGEPDRGGSRGAAGRRPGGAGVPRARVPRGGGGAALAVARRVLVRDLLRGRGDPAPPVQATARTTSSPGCTRSSDATAAEPPEPVRAGVVRPARLVAAPARVLRALRSPADADGRVPAVRPRPRSPERDRGQAGARPTAGSRTPIPSTSRASRPRRSPAASPGTGCPSGSRSWAGASTTRRCSAPRRRSSAPGPGRTRGPACRRRPASPRRAGSP